MARVEVDTIIALTGPVMESERLLVIRRPGIPMPFMTRRRAMASDVLRLVTLRAKVPIFDCEKKKKN